MTAVNAISLDVVGIGIAWQWLVGLQIGGASPRPVDSLILGLTIWLIYTMDRWLDALRLDPRRLHTARHRFHYDNRGVLLVTWIAALAIDAVLVAWQLSPGELRLVVLGTAGVLIYIACVHLLAPTSKRYFGKELAIGPLFAFGVFIPTLEQHPGISTWTCWFGLALLYMLNCVLVADHDRMADQQQNMRSLVSHDSLSRHIVAALVASYLVLIVGWVIFGVMTTVFAAALFGSALAMTLVYRIASQDESLDASGWFDLAVAFAPLFALFFQW